MAREKTVLVVDDDARVRRMLSRYLSGEGFRVVEAGDGAEMRTALQGDRFDLVLLDLVLPGEDGLSLMRDIRRNAEVPVIMITGKGELVDRVAGLETGADDYIAKPFHLREVLARVRSVLRRSAERAGSHGDAPPATGLAAAAERDRAGTNDDEALCFEGWRLDLTHRSLHRPGGKAVELTTAEFDLLAVLARAPNRPLSRDYLMDSLKGRDWSPYDRSIDTQVGRLRKKIEADPRHPVLVKTVRGVGYVFAARVEPA